MTFSQDNLCAQVRHLSSWLREVERERARALRHVGQLKTALAQAEEGDSLSLLLLGEPQNTHCAILGTAQAWAMG